MSADEASTSNNDRRIDYIEFTVNDVAEAKSFYGAVFGWKFEDYGPDYASFHDGRLAGGFIAEGSADALSAGARRIWEPRKNAWKTPADASSNRLSISLAAGAFTSPTRAATHWRCGRNDLDNALPRSTGREVDCAGDGAACTTTGN